MSFHFNLIFIRIWCYCFFAFDFILYFISFLFVYSPSLFVFSLGNCFHFNHLSVCDFRCVYFQITNFAIEVKSRCQMCIQVVSVHNRTIAYANWWVRKKKTGQQCKWLSMEIYLLHWIACEMSGQKKCSWRSFCITTTTIRGGWVEM